jgi:hypothetical protein
VDFVIDWLRLYNGSSLALPQGLDYTPKEQRMSPPLPRIALSSWTLTVLLALLLLIVPAGPTHAQYGGYGYGFPGYGYPGFGAGYGYPGFGGGYGYPGFGGGYGYPGFGGGYGSGYGYGYGYPYYGGGGSFAYGVPGISIAVPGPYGPSFYGSPGPGVYNPLFGAGLTPLGVNSALTERQLLGRGIGANTAAGRRAPAPGTTRP